MIRSYLSAVILALCAVAPVFAQEVPTIPIGYDAYRQWDKWCYQRIGARAYMRSTYDRLGYNHFADSSSFLFAENDERNVTLDVEGPGVLYFARFNHWHGSPWHFIVDGTDNVIKETSTADPFHPAENSTFIPKELFPEPLAFTWSTTKGADLIWTPMPFEKTFRLAYERTFYGTGYYIFHKYLEGTPLSQPVESWDGKTPPPEDVVKLVGKAGSDLMVGANSNPADSSKVQGSYGGTDLKPGESKVIATRSGAAGKVQSISLNAPREQALALNDVWVRITWDERDLPSVETPLPLFFGAGTFYNRDDREYLVKAFPVHVRFDEKKVYLKSYFPMPYFKSAKIELIHRGVKPVTNLSYLVLTEGFSDPPNHVGYFHATYKDHETPEPGKDLVLLDTTKTEGGGDWSGQFVGTSFIFSHDGKLGTLEGDPRFFFDDSQTPQAQGTGTEEWGGGGDYWGGRTMTLPLAGHPTGAPEGKAKNDEDKIESAYRFLLADMMPFGKNARIQLEHGGENQSTEHYKTVTYWYGLPAPSLIQTDELKLGDEKSEKQHRYVSPDASKPLEITSRYEWGPHEFKEGPPELKGKEIFPAHTDKGRTTKGVSEFTLRIAKENVGVMLRRKLDYSYPNQRAEVFIADVSYGGEVKDEDFKPAGAWYLAGSNTSVWSRSKLEVGPPPRDVRESNRRFRDDEFLIPRDLTKGRTAIRVRVKFTPIDRPLFPGHPPAPLAWSEIRYTAYSFVLPDFDVPGK